MTSNYKIAILTLRIGEKYKEFTKLGMLTQIEYCKRNGYDLIDDESVYDKSRPIPWSKILSIKKYLQQYDYIVWMDADIIILNFEVKLESFINQYLFNKESDFLMCIDTGNKRNTGVWFIKNTDYALKFMDRIYEQTNYIDAGEWEQTAFNNLYEQNIDNIQSKSTIFPYSQAYLFNCLLYDYKYGYFLIHFMGCRDLYLLSQFFKDLYPLQRDDESIDQYNSRIDNLKTKYA
jgi:hypothetical protein